MASGLSIVIDTRNAEQSIKSLGQALERLEAQGNSVANAMRKLGGNDPLAGIAAASSKLKNEFDGAARSGNLLKTSLQGVGVSAAQATAGINTLGTSLQRLTALGAQSSNVLAGFTGNARQVQGVLTQIANSSRALSAALNPQAIAALTNNFRSLAPAVLTLTTRLNNYAAAARNAQTATTGLSNALAIMRTNVLTINSALNALIPSTQRAQVDFARLQAQISAMGASVVALNNNLNHLIGSLGRVGRGFGSTVSNLQSILTGGAVGMYALSIAKTADAMQGLENQVRLVTQGEAQREEVQKRLLAIANKNYSDIEAVTSSYQRNAFALAQLGKSQLDVLNFTDALSLAMRTGGRSMLEQKSAVYQLSQAMGAGKLQGDEYRSIAENAPILLKHIAKEMGVVQGALKELSSKGKITSEIIYNAMMKARPEMEKMAQSLPITMSQAWQQVNNSYKTFVDNFMNGTGGISQSIAKMLQGAAKNFDDLAKIAIAGAGVAMLGFANKVLFTAGAFAKLTAVMKANPLFLIASVIIGASVATRGLDATLDDLGDTLSVVGSILGDVMGLFGDLAVVAGQAFSDIVSGAQNSASGSSRAFGGFFADTGTGLQGFLVGAAKVFDAIAALTRSTAQYCGERFAKFVIDTGNFFIKLGNSVRRIFADVVNFVVDSINKAVGKINALIQQTNNITIFGRSPNIGTFGMLDRVVPYTNNTTPTPAPQVDFGAIYDSNAQLQRDSGLQSYMQSKYDAIKATKAQTDADADLTGEISKGSKAKYEAANAANAAKEAAKAQQAAEKAAKQKARDTLNTTDIVLAAAKDIGINEHSNPNTIMSYQRAVGHLSKRIDAWCGSFVGASLLKAGFEIPKGGLAASAAAWERYGTGINKNGVIPAGAIATVARKGGSGRHVFIIERDNGDGTVATIEGNYGDKVARNTRSKSSLMAVRMPVAPKGKYVDTSPDVKGIFELSKAEDDALAQQLKYQEDIEQKRLELRKQYGTMEIRLTSEHTERINKIREAHLPQAEEARYIKASEAQLKRELAAYGNQLQSQLDDMLAYAQSAYAEIDDWRKKELAKIDTDDQLARPENAALRERMRKAIEAQTQYKIDMQQLADDKEQQDAQSLHQTRVENIVAEAELERRELALNYRLSETLRQARADAIEQKAQKALREVAAQFQDELDDINEYLLSDLDKIEAKYRKLKTKNDERTDVGDEQISQVRNALEGALQYERRMYQLSEQQKLLDLQEFDDKSIDMLKERLALESRLIDESNDSQAVKAAQKVAKERDYWQKVYDIKKTVGDNYGATMGALYGIGDDGRKQVEELRMAQVNAVNDALQQGIITQQQAYENMLDIDRQYIASKEAILAGGYQKTFSVLNNLLKGFGADSSKAYRVLFAIEKGYALQKALLNSKVAISSAWAQTPGSWLQKSVAVGKVIMQNDALVGAIAALTPKGFATGGYTGNLPTNQVAGVVHGREYVVNAASTAKYRDKLEAMNNGTYRETGGVNVTVNVDSGGNADVSVEAMSAMGKQMGDSMALIAQQVVASSLRQGGMIDNHMRRTR